MIFPTTIKSCIDILGKIIYNTIELIRKGDFYDRH